MKLQPEIQFFSILLVHLSYIPDTLYFSFTKFHCWYKSFSQNSPAWFNRYRLVVSLSFVNILCYTTLVVTSIFLLILARRAASLHRRSLRWKGVTTVLLTVVVLLVSYLPHGALTVALFVGEKKSSTLWRAVNFLTFLNITANFFVYYLTLRSFRLFLKLKLSELLNLMRRCTQQRAPPAPRERSYPTQATASTLVNLGSTQINRNIQGTSVGQ